MEQWEEMCFGFKIAVGDGSGEHFAGWTWRGRLRRPYFFALAHAGIRLGVPSWLDACKPHDPHAFISNGLLAVIALLTLRFVGMMSRRKNCTVAWGVQFRRGDSNKRG